MQPHQQGQKQGPPLRMLSSSTKAPQATALRTQNLLLQLLGQPLLQQGAPYQAPWQGSWGAMRSAGHRAISPVQGEVARQGQVGVQQRRGSQPLRPGQHCPMCAKQL